MNHPARMILALLFTVLFLPFETHPEELTSTGDAARSGSFSREYMLLPRVVKRYLLACVDIGGAVVVRSDSSSARDDIFGNSEKYYGQWFYLVYNDHVESFWHSAGARLRSRQELMERARQVIISSHEALIPGGGEIVISSGQTGGSFVVAGTGRKYLTRCMDLGGSVVAVPAIGSRSELFFTTEMRRGFWFCCIPQYYINYLYVSLGAGSYSRMGKAKRENGFALSGGTGLRIGVLKGFILNVEIKSYTIFKGAGTEERMVLLLGAGLRL